MHHDVLLKAGSDYATRSSLYDFIIDELKVLEKTHPHRISALRVTLENKKESLLRFIQEIDTGFQRLSISTGFSVDRLSNSDRVKPRVFSARIHTALA